MVSESGDKFGKSSGTPVWLNSAKTNSFDLYQFIIRRPDSELEKLLKYFTFLPLGEIKNTLRKHEKNPEARYGQEKLAENLTVLLHGEAGLTLAVRSTNIIYKNDISEMARLTLADARVLFQQAAYIQKLYTPGLCILGNCWIKICLMSGQGYIFWLKITCWFNLTPPNLPLRPLVHR